MTHYEEQMWSCDCRDKGPFVIKDENKDSGLGSVTQHSESCLTNRLKNATRETVTELPKFGEKIRHPHHEVAGSTFDTNVTRQEFGVNIMGRTTCDRAECYQTLPLSERTHSVVRRNVNYDFSEVTSDPIADVCKGPWKTKTTVVLCDLGRASSTEVLLPVVSKPIIPLYRAPDVKEVESGEEMSAGQVITS